MSKFSGICLEEDGRNKVYVFKAGIKMLFEGKYLVDFNSEYTKVRSCSLCTWENHDNFIISGSISKIVGPER